MISGGTLATALYQLSKPKHNKKDNISTNDTNYDPLLTTSNQTKSQYETIITHKKPTEPLSEFDNRKARPYVMSPVMANCIRRSNALLGYTDKLKYGGMCKYDTFSL